MFIVRRFIDLLKGSTRMIELHFNNGVEGNLKNLKQKYS